MGRLFSLSILMSIVLSLGLSSVQLASAQTVAPGVMTSREDIGSLSIVRTGDDGAVCMGHFGNTILCLFPNFTNPLVDGVAMGDLGVRLNSLQDIAAINATVVIAADRGTGALWRLTDRSTSTQITPADQFPNIESVSRLDDATYAVTEIASASPCAVWLLRDLSGNRAFEAGEITCAADVVSVGVAAVKKVLFLDEVNLSAFLLSEDGLLQRAEDLNGNDVWEASEISFYGQMGTEGIDLTMDGANLLHVLHASPSATATDYTATTLLPDGNGDGLPDGQYDLFTDDSERYTSLALKWPNASFTPYVDGGTVLYLEDLAFNTNVTALSADTSITPTPPPSPTQTQSPTPSPTFTPDPTATPEPTFTSTPTSSSPTATPETPVPTATPVVVNEPRIIAAGWGVASVTEAEGGSVEIIVLAENASGIGVEDGFGGVAPLVPSSVSPGGAITSFTYGPLTIPAGVPAQDIVLALTPLGVSPQPDGLAWPYLNVTP